MNINKPKARSLWEFSDSEPRILIVYRSSSAEKVRRWLHKSPGDGQRAKDFHYGRQDSENPFRSRKPQRRPRPLNKGFFEDFSIHVNLENFRMINDPNCNITQHEMEIYRLSNLLINGGARDWRNNSDYEPCWYRRLRIIIIVFKRLRYAR